MALQPTTATELSLDDPFDPYANVDGGTRLLKQLSREFDGDIDLILAGYNAGVNAVKRFHGVPRFPETMDYVKYTGGIYNLCKADPRAFSPSILGSHPTWHDPSGPPTPEAGVRGTGISRPDLRYLHDRADFRLVERPPVGRILLERQVSPRAVIVREVARQDASEVPLAEHEDVVQTPAPD